MSPLAGVGLPAYGLRVNPFATETLNPLARADDEKHVSIVDGWKGLDEARRLISRRAAAGEAVFIVVAGASSTGRTSVAYYLVHLWAQAHGIHRDVVVDERSDPGPNGGVFSPEVQLMNWAQGLLFRKDIDHLGLTAQTRARLENLAPSDSLVKFGLAVRDVDKELATPKAGQQVRYLAAILERGKGDDLIPKVRKCFEATRAIVIVTVDASAATSGLLENAGKAFAPDGGLCVRLGPILGADVATVIRDRWDAVSGGVENPFDLAAAAHVFDSPRTIARTMHLLHRMLYWRSLFHEHPAPWPESRSLALGGDKMRAMLAEFEGQVPPEPGG